MAEKSEKGIAGYQPRAGACPKRMLNGPCGGVRDGKCEVGDSECIWVSIYNKMESEGRPQELLNVRMPEASE
jgi:hypothetical protein